MSNKQKDTGALRGNIEDTRQRISGEIEAIGERLTPGHARDVAKERMIGAKDRAIAGARTSARNAAHVARNAPSELPRVMRENPIPSAMVLVGSGWLVWTAARKVRASRQRALPAGVEYQAAPGYLEPGYVGEPGYIGEPGYDETVAPEVPSVTARERVGAATSRTRERLGSAASGARERIAGSASAIKGRAGHLAEKGKQRAANARGRSEDAFGGNPLAFGALALFTGVGIGMMLPHTRREDRVLGAPRERVLGRAKHAAHEAKDVAMHSAKEGMRAARETAKEDSAGRDFTSRNI